MDFIIVGTGWAGEHHAQAIRALHADGADAHIAALVDVDPDHLARCAAAWGVERTFTSLGKALDAVPDAMAVVLATPHHVHREGAEQAAAGGRHVLVEKPMALTLEDADAMIEACGDAGVMLMVLESARYERANRTIAEAVRTGKIGQPLSGRINRISRGHPTYSFPGRRAWLSDPEVCGGGIWMVNGIHMMSRLRMFLGEVTRIDAREVHSDKFESPLEATVVALLDFECGAVATATLSAELHSYKRFGDLVLFGADGTLGTLGYLPDEIRIHREGTDEVEIIQCSRDTIRGADGHFVRQMAEFLAAVEQRREPETNGPSERRSLAVVLAGYESIRTGEPVRL